MRYHISIIITGKSDKDELSKNKRMLYTYDEGLVNKGKVSKEFFKNRRQYLHIRLNERRRIKICVFSMDSIVHIGIYACLKG